MYQKLFLLFFVFSNSLFAELGLAGWYGQEFQGKTTSSGEKFNMYAYTAAHKTLPLNSVIEVTNLENRKSVKVRINDRNLKPSNRVIDLSYQAAKTIGMLSSGTARVRLQSMKPQKVTQVHRLHHVNASQEEIASMREYALTMLSVPTQYTTPATVAYSAPTSIAPSTPPSVKPQKKIKLQIGSFATQRAAHNFVREERSKGYEMKVISYFSSKFHTFRYKVVILSPTLELAHQIINAQIYKGAYILR